MIEWTTWDRGESHIGPTPDSDHKPVRTGTYDRAGLPENQRPAGDVPVEVRWRRSGEVQMVTEADVYDKKPQAPGGWVKKPKKPKRPKGPKGTP